MAVFGLLVVPAVGADTQSSPAVISATCSDLSLRAVIAVTGSDPLSLQATIRAETAASNREDE